MKLGPTDRENIRSASNLPSKLPKNLQKKSYHTRNVFDKQNAAKRTSIIFNETYTKLSEIVRNENKSQVSGTRWTAKT